AAPGVEVMREWHHDCEQAGRDQDERRQAAGEGPGEGDGNHRPGSSGREPRERISARPRSDVARARNGATPARRSGRKTTPRVRTAGQVPRASESFEGATPSSRRARRGGRTAARENTPTARGVVASAKAIASSWSSTWNRPLPADVRLSS